MLSGSTPLRVSPFRGMNVQRKCRLRAGKTAYPSWREEAGRANFERCDCPDDRGAFPAFYSFRLVDCECDARRGETSVKTEILGPSG